ncbi:MAG TPA: ammonium transporter [Nocardia sp.]|uniref:ammonium transporter n=1 Tax=Nocardia TaxID=1817 RepID=UPI0024575F24|nr:MULTISPECIES: ammonium transporter [Nocardia]HLS76999.1 ammonium transporter [Nocardia sp.]
MRMRKLSAVLVPLIAAVTVGASTAHAEPAPVPDVGYEAKLVGEKVVTTLTNGTFTTTDDGIVEVKDSADNVLLSFPLTFRQEGLEYPLGHEIADEGHRLELTVVKDETKARPVPVTPVASLEENNRAMETFASQFGLATAIGGFVGLAAGAAIGCVITLPACLPGLVTGASVGGIIGTLVVGGPTLVVAGIDLIQTLAAEPGSTKWMDQTGRPAN